MFRKLGINIFPKTTEDKKLQRHGQIYIFFLEIFIVQLSEFLVEWKAPKDPSFYTALNHSTVKGKEIG